MTSWWAPGQLQDKLVLCPVGVLVLVHQYVGKAVLVGGEHVRVLAEQPDGEHEQVVEIHGVGRHQPLLVLRVDLGDLPLENGAAPGPLGVRSRAQ